MEQKRTVNCDLQHACFRSQNPSVLRQCHHSGGHSCAKGCFHLATPRQASLLTRCGLPQVFSEVEWVAYLPLRHACREHPQTITPSVESPLPFQPPLQMTHLMVSHEHLLCGSLHVRNTGWLPVPYPTGTRRIGITAPTISPIIATPFHPVVEFRTSRTTK